MNARTALAELEALADPNDAVFLQRFFKTGPGQYGEGDRFLGIRVPATRKLARSLRGTPLDEVVELLQSQWHEARLLALLILVDAYERGSTAERKAMFDIYLANARRVNNWDLVDLSAPNIVGRHLAERSRTILRKLARSKLLWERRIAIVATFTFIREGDFGDTLEITELLLNDEHDLIHKACGWMLREVGKRDRRVLELFLDRHATRMPRTMLRYAIEHFPASLRTKYMEMR